MKKAVPILPKPGKKSKAALAKYLETIPGSFPTLRSKKAKMEGYSDVFL